MSRFTSRATHRFDLSQGEHGPEYVDLRDELSAWERDQMQGHIITAGLDLSTLATSATVEMAKYRWAILEAYIAGWQIFDHEGQLVPYSPSALQQLDEETVVSIIAHIDQWVKAQAEEKKVPDGQSRQTIISGSPSASDGHGPMSKKRQPASSTVPSS